MASGVKPRLPMHATARPLSCLDVMKKNCVRLPAPSPMKTEHNHNGSRWICSPALLTNATSSRSVLPRISHVWMAYCINVNATFMLTQALLPLLLKSDSGSLVFTSSSVGRQGRANWGAYATSKFATEGMMQVLADEYQNRHLRVNCINPGGTRTGMRASAFPTEDPQKLKTPADIMPLYLWLMGDDSRRKTGMTFDAQPGRNPGIAQ